MKFNIVGSTLKVTNLILVRTPILVVHETQIEVFKFLSQKKNRSSFLIQNISLIVVYKLLEEKITLILYCVIFSMVNFARN